MKLRVVELLLITTVPTMVLAEKGWPSWDLVVVTLIGGPWPRAGPMPSTWSWIAISTP